MHLVNKKKYVITLDSSSSSCTASLMELRCDDIKKINVIKTCSLDLNVFKKDGMFEYDAEEIWKKQLLVLEKVIEDVDLNCVLGISIANQRETIVAWDKDTLKPLYFAISWQDNREDLKKMKKKYVVYEDLIRKKTGLYLSEYFSALKIRWILDNVNHPIEKIRVGTIDSWLLINLTSGKSFYTDVTNASRTLLFNLEKESWDEELLDIFKIPKILLPEIKSSGSFFGYWKPEKNFLKIEICGIIGDQQASLLSYGFKKNLVKCTYGTGIFVSVNLCHEKKFFKNLLTTIGWKIENQETIYSLEVGSFVGGGLVSNLKEKGFFHKYEIDDEFNQIEDNFYFEISNDYVFIVPNFSFLLNKNSYKFLEKNNGNEFVVNWNLDLFNSVGDKFFKSVLNGITLIVNDLFSFVKKNINFEQIFVDGNLSDVFYLKKTQSLVSNVDLVYRDNSDNTSLGASYLVYLFKNELTYKDIDLINLQNNKKLIAFDNQHKDKEVVKLLLNRWESYKISL